MGVEVVGGAGSTGRETFVDLSKCQYCWRTRKLDQVGRVCIYFARPAAFVVAVEDGNVHAIGVDVHDGCSVG